MTFEKRGRVFFVCCCAVFASGALVGCDGAGDEGEGEGEEGEEGEGEVINDDPPGDADVLVGAFALKLDPDEQLSSFVGKVFDGPTPAGVLFDVEAVAGECTLSIPRVPFCETPCGAALCVDDDVCQAFPASQSVGTVSVSGLGADFSIEPIGNSYQPGAAVELAFPAVAAGDEFVVDAEGSASASPFTLTGHGVAPLALVEEALALTRGEDFVVAWAAGDPALARMKLKLDISHHGGTRGVVECDAADDGEVVVDAALVDALLDLGVAGFPTVVLARSATTSTVMNDGRVDLNVTSSVERAVDIEGLESCLSDDDCTAPATCGADLVCQ